MKYGYKQVTLTANGVQDKHLVHSLVAAAFIGPRPFKLDILHLDDDPTNNALSNLEYDTHKRNMELMSEHGRGRKPGTHCDKGHEFTEANTYWADGKRYCRPCKAAYHAERHQEEQSARGETETRTCPGCGGEFEKSTRFGENRREYCSRPCQQKAKQRARKEHKAAALASGNYKRCSEVGCEGMASAKCLCHPCYLRKTGSELSPEQIAQRREQGAARTRRHRAKVQAGREQATAQ
jgi:hypothetical protein